MKRRFTAFALALAVCLGLCVTAGADGENTDTVLPFVRVTGADGKIENCDLVDDGGGNGWTWTSATQTLTLNNFNGGDIIFDGNYGSSLRITICQSGVNTVDGTIGFIKVKGAFDFTGDGSLTVTGELQQMEFITLWSGKLVVAEKENDYKGIYCPVTVNGGELDVRAERFSTALTLNAGLVKAMRLYGVDEETPLVFNGGSLSLDNPLPLYSEHITGDYHVTLADGTPGDDVPVENWVYPVLYTSTGTGVPSQSEPTAPEEPTVPAGPQPAVPTASTVLFNGGKLSFDAYNIGGANYFKLRDLAYVLSGSEKQFSVGWDGAANTITLTSGQPYEAVGGEMVPGTAQAQTATPTASKLLVDGAEVSLTAYNIGGANYFKLRDIGQLFDFGVGWDSVTKTIAIDTTTGYTPG